MECTYLPINKSFAVKRFERIFSDEQRGVRLLRELTILKNADHRCLNKLVTVFPLQLESTQTDAYLVL